MGSPIMRQEGAKIQSSRELRGVAPIDIASGKFLFALVPKLSNGRPQGPRSLYQLLASNRASVHCVDRTEGNIGESKNTVRVTGNATWLGSSIYNGTMFSFLNGCPKSRTTLTSWLKGKEVLLRFSGLWRILLPCFGI